MRLAPGPGSAAELVHRVPRTPVIDRREILLQLARGRRVAHLGFVDYGLRNSGMA